MQGQGTAGATSAGSCWALVVRVAFWGQSKPQWLRIQLPRAFTRLGCGIGQGQGLGALLVWGEGPTPPTLHFPTGNLGPPFQAVRKLPDKAIQDEVATEAGE